MPGRIPEASVLNSFDKMLRHVWRETLVTLERYAEVSYSAGIPNELAREFPDAVARAEETAAEQGFKAGTIGLFSEWYPALREAFLSVSQSRKTRGGKDFELQIEGLFRLAGIPFHKQERENRTDLIIPNLQTHSMNRNISLIVSVKRTLRERWAEVAEELFNLRSPNVFLFTADENISSGHVTRLQRYNIHLVVWDDLKTKKFKDEHLVLGYTEWATRRLSQIRQFWA